MWLKLKFYILAFLVPIGLFAIGVEPHHITAYIGRPGQIDLLFSSSYYRTDHFWDRHGKVCPTFNRFKSLSFNFYGEWAWKAKDSFFLNSGYTTVVESLNGTSRAVEDVAVGWKHLLFQRGCEAWTLECIGIIPAGPMKSSVRYGHMGFQASILYSNTLRRLPIGFDVNLGYRVYKGFPSDEVRGGLAIKYDLFSWMQWIASGDIEYGVYNGYSRGNWNTVVNFPNHRLLNAKIECVLQPISLVRISIGAFKHLLGRHVGTGGGFFLGSWFDF